MNISKIELDNFRQYSGKIEFEFNTDSKKNIAVILGVNGAGNSNLYNSTGSDPKMPQLSLSRRSSAPPTPASSASAAVSIMSATSARAARFRSVSFSGT